MNAQTKRMLFLATLAISLLASGCATSSNAALEADSNPPVTNEGDPVSDMELAGPLDAVHVSPAPKIDPDPVAVFDEPGLQVLRNAVNYQAGNFGREATTAAIPGLQDVDWDREFVLLAVIDACQPESVAIALGEVNATLSSVESGILCESDSPHGAFFIVPRSVDINDATVAFTETTLPTVDGARVDVLLPAERDGVRPIGVFSAEELERQQRPENDVAFVFDNTDDTFDVLNSMSLLDDNDGIPQRTEAQLAAVDVESEFVLIVAYDVCAPVGFELVQTDAGFTQVLTREDVDCAWAPPVVLVYVAPRAGSDGVEYSPEVLPEISYELAE